MKLPVSDTDKADRLANLRKRKVLLDGVHTVLHAPVLGDFLVHKHPQKKIMKVVKSYKTALLLQQLLPQNPQPTLLPMMEKSNISTLQEAARALAGVKRTLELGRSVFALIWQVIARLALPKDQYFQRMSLWQETQNKLGMPQTAKRCNDVFALIERRHISWEFLPRDFKAEIASEMEAEHGGDQDYFQLFESSTFTEFWGFRRSYPNHPAHQKDAVKARVIEFLQQKNAGMLPEILKAEFQRYGVTMRSDSRFIRQFSEGTVCCQPEEVVATMYLTGKLFDYSHRVWSQLGGTFESEVKQMVFAQGIGWMEAVKALTASDDFKEQCRSVPIYSYRSHRGEYDYDEEGWSSPEYYRERWGYPHYHLHTDSFDLTNKMGKATLTFNSKSSLITGVVLVTLGIAFSSLIFFSGLSTVRFISSISLFVLERTDTPRNTALSASTNIWGFCQYLELDQKGDDQCTVFTVSQLFSGSFSFNPTITLPVANSSATGYVQFAEVVNAFPFKGHPIAFVGLLGVICFGVLGLGFAALALSFKESNPKSWSTCLRVATGCCSFTMVSSMLVLVGIVVTNDAFIKVINNNSSTVNMNAKWGVMSTAFAAVATFCCLFGSVLVSRANVLAQGSIKAKEARLTALSAANANPPVTTAPGTNPYTGERYDKSPLPAAAPGDYAASTVGASTYPTLSQAPSQAATSGGAYDPYYASGYPPTTTTTAAAGYPATTSGDYSNAYTNAYGQPAATGYAQPADYNTAVNSTAPSTYVSGSTNNQYATWQSAGYQPTTAEATYHQNYGYSTSDASYYAQRQQQQGQAQGQYRY
ncbi:hypothetical protein HDU96_009310 [Phlyctochytrium bullatum]|nr:hypothetical protein HDU96_009310 [Phlyctochytrium bullatum]